MALGPTLDAGARQRAGGARFFLRDATYAAHARVDAAFGDIDLGRLDGYLRFLQIQRLALAPVEEALETARIVSLVPDWPERRRLLLLDRDLTELGAVLHPGGPALVLAEGPASLGALYVLEGSRLGGSVLARDVPEHFPRRFLTSGDPSRWRSLISLLDRHLRTDADLRLAATAALTIFHQFEQAVSQSQ